MSRSSRQRCGACSQVLLRALLRARRWLGCVLLPPLPGGPSKLADPCLAFAAPVTVLRVMTVGIEAVG